MGKGQTVQRKVVTVQVPAGKAFRLHYIVAIYLAPAAFTLN
jgi:hypothetical protein